MSVSFKIVGGTVADKHICLECRHGFTRADAHGREETRCKQFAATSKNMIVKCNSFAERPKESPVWMLEQALYVYTSYRSKVYFLSRTQYQDDNYTDHLNDIEAKEEEEAAKKAAARAKGSMRPVRAAS